MTRQGLSEVLSLLEAAYRIKFKPIEAKAWNLLLAPIRDEEGKEAAVRLCRESPFPPKPADIFRLVAEDRELRRIPPLALPEPVETHDPEKVNRVRAFMREAVQKIGKPIQ